MTNLSLSQAQADMRTGYQCGAPGVLVSGLVWLTAGVVATRVSATAAVYALLIGGAAIHPLGVLLTKLIGAPGRHDPSNPLARLAAEGTLWMLAGIAIAYGMHVLRIEWFFPAMLLVIGGRYLTFQTLYGVRLYWALGGVLCLLGVGLALARAPAPLSAFAGGAVEVLFAILLFRSSRET